MTTLADTLREEARKVREVENDQKESRSKEFAHQLMIDWESRVLTEAKKGVYKLTIEMFNYKNYTNVDDSIILDEIRIILKDSGIKSYIRDLYRQIILSWEC